MRYYPTLVLILILQGLCFHSDAQIRVMSYNIRYDNPRDSIHNWHHRKDQLVAYVRAQNPDFLGIQEGLVHQVDYLDAGLPQMTYLGVGRQDGISAGEYTALYYNQERFEVISHATFWLSSTPDLVSRGWDAALPRICTYGIFREKSSGRTMAVFNTHFDHRGKKARGKSAKLIRRKISTLAEDMPSILMGDLNLPPRSRGIRYIARSMMDPTRAVQIDGPSGTWCGFEDDGEMGERIDYIFSQQFRPLHYHHQDPLRSDIAGHLSDHLPVLAVFHWSE